LGNKNLCPKCGLPKKSSKKSKMYRKLVNQTANLPDLEFLRPILKETKNYCDECWKAEVMPVAKRSIEYDL